MGKPAARLGDGTAKGGPITGGSSGVLIGSPNGIACSACPGGIAVGNPVNPMLGAKVLSNEVDIALPSLMPFIFSRSYSSYQTETPAPVGLLGPGWNNGSDLSLLITDAHVIVNDISGRSIHFEPMSEGEVAYSHSESLWLIRGGAPISENHALFMLWNGLPQHLREDPHFYFGASDPTGTLFIFGYHYPYHAKTDILPQPLPKRRYLEGIIDRFGNNITYQRNGNNDVVKVKDGAGRVFAFELIQLEAYSQSAFGPDKGQRLRSIALQSDPNYPTLKPIPLVRYEYTAHGELKTVYDRTDDAIRHFEYGSHDVGRMSAHAFAGRPQTTYEYDKKGRVIRQINPNRLSYAFTYRKNQTTVKDSLERKTVYHFQGERGLRRLVKLEHPDGTLQTSLFDKHGRLIAEIDPLGRKTEYELDMATGKLLGVTTPDGKESRFTYDTLRNLTRITRPDGTQAESHYDSLGRLIKATNPLGDETQYQYPNDQTNRIATVIDPAGAEQHFEWNDRGQLLKQMDCSGYKTRYEYYLLGEVSAIYQEEGQVSFYQYDKKGRLISINNGADETIQYQYNDASERIQTTFNDGSRETVTFNAWGDALTQTYGGLTQHLYYDKAGRISTITNENGAQTTFQYDSMDRLIEQIGFDEKRSTYHYNALGMLTKSTDADRVKQYIYDDDFRLEKERVIQEDVVQHERVFTYDMYDRVTALTHQQGDYHVKTLFTLDKVGRIVKDRQQILDQNQQILWDYHTEHTYQAQGLPEQTTFAGLDPFDWHYYGSGHLFEVAQQGEPLVDWTPDRLHRQREMRFGENLIHSDYDPSGRLHTLNHAHHPQLSREHRYDQRGLLTAIQTSSGIDQYHYDPAGRLIESQMTQGIEMQQTHYQYDPAGNRIADTKAMILNNQPAEDDHFIYEYDRYGNLIKKLDKASQRQHLYDYDAMNRLVLYNRIEASVLTTKAHYVYDALGRRLQKKVERVERHSRAVKKEAFFYGWDGDHLVVTEKDQQRVYTLYAQGSFAPLLRIEGERQEQQTSLVDHIEALIGDSLDATTQAEFEGIEKGLQNEGLTIEQTAFLDKMHLSEASLRHYLPEEKEKAEFTTHLYANDHLGTPMALLTPDGDIEWERQQDAFGNTLKEQNNQNLYQPIRFQGQHYDEESGLYYNRHRYYDPSQGKYISQDPIGLNGGLNFYQYPLNPVMMLDPLGLWGSWNVPPGIKDAAGKAKANTEASIFGTAAKVYNESSTSVIGGIEGALFGKGGVNAGVTSTILKDGTTDYCALVEVCFGGGAEAGASASTVIERSNLPTTTGLSSSMCVTGETTVGGGMTGSLCSDVAELIENNNITGGSVSAGPAVGAKGGAGVSYCTRLNVCNSSVKNAIKSIFD